MLPREAGFPPAHGQRGAGRADRASPTPNTRATVGRMVAFDPDALIGDLNNALADQVFYKRGRTTWARRRVNPTQATTAYRVASATRRQTNAAAWANSLSTQQRDAWRWQAMNRNFTRRRLSRPTLSGWHLFNSVNHVRQLLGLSVLTDPPGPDQTDPPYQLELTTLDATAQQLVIDFAGAALPNVATLIYASGNCPAGWHPRSGRVRFIGSIAPGTARPVDISSLWLARFGTLDGGAAVGVAVAAANQLTGYLSIRAYASAVATGTSVPTLSFFRTPYAAPNASGPPAANAIELTPFTLAGQITPSKVGINILAANPAVTGDFGIYDTAGNRLMSVGGFSIAATGVQELAFAGTPPTLQPGTYYAAWTQTDTSGRIGIWNIGGALVPLTTSRSTTNATAGVLPATIVIPAQGIVNNILGWMAFTLR